MLRHGSAGLMVMAALVTGCQNKPGNPSPPLQPVPTEQIADNAREQLQRVNPHAQVGTVLTVYNGLAAVVDVDVNQFSVGSPITFLDGNMNDITMGQVLKISPDDIVVKFEPPQPGQRSPHKGDLAVFLSNGPIIRPAHPPAEPATEAATAEPSAPAAPSVPAPATAPETPAPATPAATEPAKAAPKDNASDQKPDLNK